VFHIVDDQSNMCEVVDEIIALAGYECLQFHSAEAYLKFMQSNGYRAPIALFTDYMMPGMNGEAFATAVRSIQPEQNIILVSAYLFSNHPPCNSGLFNQYLAKPFQVESMLSMLHSLVLKNLPAY